jgi:hypothetical protein
MRQRSRNDLVNAFVDLVADLGTGRAVQTETAIACAGRLAGSLLLRSFGFDLSKMEPGNIVLSEEANTKGPQLISIAAAVVKAQGFSIDARSCAQKGRGHEPEISVGDSLAILQDKAIRVCTEQGFSLEEGAQCAAGATGFIVTEAARSMDVEVAFNVAVFAIITGCKTVPPRPIL